MLFEGLPGLFPKLEEALGKNISFCRGLSLDPAVKNQRVRLVGWH